MCRTALRDGKETEIEPVIFQVGWTRDGSSAPRSSLCMPSYMRDDLPDLSRLAAGRFPYHWPMDIPRRMPLVVSNPDTVRNGWIPHVR